LSNYDHIIIYKLKSSPSAKKFVALLKAWSPVVQEGDAYLPTQVRIRCRLQSMARQEKRKERRACLDSCYHFTECLDRVPTGAAGPRCMVLLSGGFRGTASPFMPHRWLFTRPVLARTTPILLYKQSPLLALPFQATSQTCSSKNHLPFNSVPPSKRKIKKKKKSSLKMKINSASMGSSKRRISSKGLGAVLREQRARLYIIRRCVVMLVCWHD
jgi:hypothetical protein